MSSEVSEFENYMSITSCYLICEMCVSVKCCIIGNTHCVCSVSKHNLSSIYIFFTHNIGENSIHPSLKLNPDCAVPLLLFLHHIFTYTPCGSMGLQMDFLIFSYSFFFTPPTFGCKDDIYLFLLGIENIVGGMSPSLSM